MMLLTQSVILVGGVSEVLFLAQVVVIFEIFNWADTFISMFFYVCYTWIKESINSVILSLL